MSETISRRDFLKRVSVGATTLFLASCNILPSVEKPRISGDLLFDEPHVIDEFWGEKGLSLTSEGLSKKDIGSFTAKISMGELKRDAYFIFNRNPTKEEIFLVKDKDNNWTELARVRNGVTEDIQLLDTRVRGFDLLLKGGPVFGWNGDNDPQTPANPYFVNNRYLLGDFLPGVDDRISIPLTISGPELFPEIGQVLETKMTQSIKKRQIVYQA